ncbi:MAG TPA: DotD/TraH family lipoprotein [Patescibacteria group bacterium]|jgi:defect-in-organelle-trafficking protein DotD|nr:DotD/TraH family lipoprotein [Patescibacteria group bacterium]
MIRYKLIPGLAVATILLAGCNSLPPSPQIATQPDKVSAMLAQAADRASTSLQTLAAVEQARSPGIAVAPIDNAPPELRRAVTVSWTGPVEPVTRMLADRASYVFQTLGDPPPVAAVVSLNVENKPVIEVLRDIGLQMGMRGDVRVDAQRKIVEIHYAPDAGVGE